MIKIAIIDDIYMFCNELQNMLEQILKQLNEEMEIYTFRSGEEFLDFYQKKDSNIELIFLDIEMPEMNGISVSSVLREIERDNAIQIIYISAKEKYAMRLFQYRPFDFLLKPVSQPILQECVERYLQIFQTNKQFFRYMHERQQKCIEISRIVYFESHGRMINMHTTDETCSFYSKLDDVSENVPERRFLRIHHSILVNLTYISEFRFDSVTLVDNSTLPISRGYQKNVRDWIMQEQKSRIKRSI